MADVTTNLLWHAGRDLGAEILARLGKPELPTHPAHEPVPPALLEDALRCGDAKRFVALHRGTRRGRNTRAAEADSLLRLLERDDPDTNEALFHHSDWPALRQAVLGQRRHAPGADAAAGLVPLNASLRERIFAVGALDDLQAALWAADPELAFWALAGTRTGSAHGGALARVHACLTLGAAGRRAQVRHIIKHFPIDLPVRATPEAYDQLHPGRPQHLIRPYLEEAYSPETLVAKLAAARKTAAGRSLVRDVLEPPWAMLAAAHAETPLPWGAAVALLEHTRCPAEFLRDLLRSHPTAVEMVPSPGPEVLAVCAELGQDQLTKKVLLRGIASGSIDATVLVYACAPARLALATLVHGGNDALATQAAATALVREMLAAGIRDDAAGWRAVYTALPDFAGPAAALLLDDQFDQPDQDGALPKLSGQSARAYTTLLAIAGPEAAAPALGFLDDARLAPLAGCRELPGHLAAYVLAHGGPVAHRVLAGNPSLPTDMLETLALTADRATASAVYRNPRCPFAVRQYLLSLDAIDDDLRTELLAEHHEYALWPLLASPDAELLRHVAQARPDAPNTHWMRLRAAHRLAELHGVAALEGLPSVPPVDTARQTRGITPLTEALHEADRAWAEALAKTRTLPYPPSPDGVHGALADPGLDWRTVLAATRRGQISDQVRDALQGRPDYPRELALFQAAPRRTSNGKYLVSDSRLSALHRAHAVAVLPAAPVVWVDALRPLSAGTVSAAEFLAATFGVLCIQTAVSHPPLAREVAVLLHAELGGNVDAWVVVARMLGERTLATLPEIVATARAAV